MPEIRGLYEPDATDTPLTLPGEAIPALDTRRRLMVTLAVNPPPKPPVSSAPAGPQQQAVPLQAVQVGSSIALGTFDTETHAYLHRIYTQNAQVLDLLTQVKDLLSEANNIETGKANP